MSIPSRVTLQDIEANIRSECYFTAADGCWGGEHSKSLNDPDFVTLRLLTFCVLILRNGFTVTGESACVDPASFDEDIGRKVARQNAIAKMWPLMGYALKTQLSQQAS